ncbi:hypothetical protein PHLCEN_2v10233, partial [Hermanssonia centrifuga]
NLRNMLGSNFLPTHPAAEFEAKSHSNGTNVGSYPVPASSQSSQSSSDSVHFNRLLAEAESHTAAINQLLQELESPSPSLEVTTPSPPHQHQPRQGSTAHGVPRDDLFQPWMSYMVPGFVDSADRLFEPNEHSLQDIHRIEIPTDDRVTETVLSLLDPSSGVCFGDLMRAIGACSVCGRIFGFNAFPYHQCVHDLMTPSTLTTYPLPHLTMSTGPALSRSSTPPSHRAPFPPISPLFLSSPLPSTPMMASSPLPSTPTMASSPLPSTPLGSSVLHVKVKEELVSAEKLQRRLRVKQEVADGSISLFDLTDDNTPSL